MRLLFLILPLSALAYVMTRVYHILPFSSLGKSFCVVLGLLIFVSMILSFVIGFDNKPILLSTLVYEISTSWLFILLYLFMIFLLMDLLRFCHVLPREILFSSVKGTLIVFSVIFCLFLYGNINYYNKKRVHLRVKTEKQLDKPLKIVMISDLHIGFHNQRPTLAKWVDMINKEQADMILIAGDIIDISTYPLFKQKSYEEFRCLNAPVYACLGNHEYISGNEKVLEFYKLAGINLLRDSYCEDKGITIVGRDDRSNNSRKTISQIIQGADSSCYTVLLDHQPYNLEQSEQSNIDFQFSGHTHYGQVFPINLITDAIYEKAYGQHKRGNTDYYISSGLGIWGGKFRIGTKSEYVVMELSN